MADDAREYVRAAQAAEVRGDKAQAVEMLRKAAALYRGQGNSQRALQMLRHARRLDGASAELADELSRMEWLPDRPMEQAAGAEEAERALAPLDEFSRPKRLIERGPTRADPALEAWCSFCCRPRNEVGDLVAGPAGAFICASCVGEAGQLLGAPRSMASAAPLPQLESREASQVVEAFRSLVERVPVSAWSRAENPPPKRKGRKKGEK